MKNQVLVVLGMHRSGTSLLTGLLSEAGVSVGKRLYAPQIGVNEKGFWEHEDIVDLHDELLLHLYSQWDDILPLPEFWWKHANVAKFKSKLIGYVNRDFVTSKVWAIKDPRMCRLLPLWLEIFSDLNVSPVFVCLNRKPSEVVASLKKRDGFSEEKALVLWLNHTLNAEQFSRNKNRVFLDFDTVAESPETALYKIDKLIEGGFPLSLSDVKEKLNDFVSPSLRHHNSANNSMLSGCLGLLAERLYKELSSGKDVDTSLIDTISSEFDNYQKTWSTELLEQVRYLNAERADYRIKFFQIYRSLSWLLIKPLWYLERWLRNY
ncbi:sulfotransferase family protein [Methylomonas sp. HYX-M1]|uniref:sulfotransferase family protein n=1 Tax=Methylomonas sp. HYX-M1 TaxID=3139307 RepID=UPI00345BCA2C